MPEKIIKNPFLPGFGRKPPMVLDQDETLNDYLSALQNMDGKYQTSLVYGVRGAGKTVFLINVRNQLKKIDGWYFVQLSLSQGNLLNQLIRGLQKIGKIDWEQVLKGFSAQLNFAGIGFTIRSEQNEQTLDYKGILEEMLLKLKKQKIFVLIGIDEIEISNDVRAFALLYQILIGEELNLALIMTGLPSRVSDLQKDKVLTFLYRSNRIYLEKLDRETVINSYEEAFKAGNKEIAPMDIDRLAEAAGGYPYAFQTVGYYAWRLSESNQNIIDNKVIKQTIKRTQNDLYHNSYEQLYTEISSTDRDFLNAMAEYSNNSVPINWIQKKLNKSKNYLSVYRARLKDDQLIDTAQRGFVTFTLPYFKEFISWFKESHFL
ncbi:hypothetical protein OZX69_03880 [Lactobacillus sp. ESL0731]|uniref:hypothetical protein n=1 Tax=unclassified Lactobacillus TaxID=2620435 RepID=UPI0023F77865|nr:MULTISPECIES: hypothetical protein [unclassified Lactobacillus]WEV51849.1 hypothetical protein OZX63_03875 [Lactobacillus sp. ESL0700]WEV62979.1 hypothetical protein OZX69_03880 [Lactobacillus sp. ESL0731]